MTRHEIARILEEIAYFLELKGENPFKAKAYSNAARLIKTLPEEPALLVQRQALEDIKGIGPALSATVTELVTTGTCALYQELTALFPASLLEFDGVSGLAPEKVRRLYELIGVTSLGELEYACIENRLVDLRGFGRKTQEKILASIRRFQRHRGSHLYADVIEEASRVLQAIQAASADILGALAGDLRRKLEVVQDISIVVGGCSSARVKEALMTVPEVSDIVSDSSLITARSLQGIPISIRLAELDDYGWELFVATGNSAHVEAVRQRLASSRHFPTEEAVYTAAGLPLIPPELREGGDEVELAASGRLPVLIEAGQIQGIFHNHTLYSDGSGTVEEMVGAAQALGYRYIGISDHSQSAHYANGLKEDRIRIQRAEMEAVQKRLPAIRIFKGIEADILEDGAMDYPDEILASFDFVIASIHSRFGLSEEDQTRRICRALTNPYVTMLGHATGRLLLSREGYRVDMRKVIDTAAANRKIIEINASPHRLELDWRLCGYARDRGVKLCINPDAHSPGALTTVPLGVNVARKGGLSAGDVINTLPVEQMADYLKSLRP